MRNEPEVFSQNKPSRSACACGVDRFGLLTHSQARICSGLAKPMRIASKLLTSRRFIQSSMPGLLERADI